jgi:phospholipase C
MLWKSSLLTISVLALAACSSKDEGKAPAGAQENDASTIEGGGSCKPNPKLEARRDSCDFAGASTVTDTIGACVGDAIPIEHIVILMQENRSFDQYFGHLPGHGQDDVDVAKDGATNVNPSGGAPIPWHHETSYCVEDTDHGWVASHKQWNNGKNDGFAITNMSNGDPTGQRGLGYYDQTDLPFYYELTSIFATSDRYFCSLLGPTYPNRMYLYGGTSYGVVDTNLTDLLANKLSPPGAPNIFRAMEAKGITWNVYESNLPGNAVFLDVVTDQTFSSHYKKVADFQADAAAGTLPQVSFVDASYSDKAWLESDEHPPANIQLGQHFVWEQVKALTSSPLWPKSAMFVTYDEHGGLYDKVSPPPACPPDDIAPKLNPELGGFDRLGFRVPLIVVSPWVQRHHVSHKVHSHTSVLRFIEAKFDLPAITKRDANSDALLDLFDFGSAPRLDVPAFTEPPVDSGQIEACKAAFGGAASPDGG